jgi:hypothetical protein
MVMPRETETHGSNTAPAFFRCFCRDAVMRFVPVAVAADHHVHETDDR